MNASKGLKYPICVVDASSFSCIINLMFVCLRVLPLEDRAIPPGQDRYSAAVGRIWPRSSPPVRPQTTLFLRPPLGDSAVPTTRRQTTGHLVHYLTNLFLHLQYIVFIFYYLLNTIYYSSVILFTVHTSSMVLS